MTERTKFEFDDRTEEMTAEEIALACELSSDILAMFEEKKATPEQALQTATAIVSYTLAEFSCSRAHANKALELFCMSIVATLTQAEEDGLVNWNMRSRH